MLNEIFELSQSMRRLGIQVVSWHRYLKECPRGKTFFVDLNAKSEISAIREITDPGRLTQLRKYEKAAGYSFPSFNILPLWQLTDRGQIETAGTLRRSIGSKKIPSADDFANEVMGFVANARSAWIDVDKKLGGRDAMDKVNGCLGSVIADLSKLVRRSDNDNSKSFVAIMERASLLDGDRLHHQLSNWLVSQFKNIDGNWLTWFDMLFSLSDSKPKAWSIVFELSDQSAFQYPVNHDRVYDFLNNCLQQGDAKSAEEINKKSIHPDAFGAIDGGRDESFPEVKMSRFGKINLRAMSRESLCQVRYGFAESKSFPVAQSVRQECKNSLEWISRDERQGITWCDISSVNGRSTVLFAYPSKLADQVPAYASLLNGDEDSGDLHIEGKFEACAKSIADAISGRTKSEEMRDIVIFALTKPDGFRTKVLYSSRFSESHIIVSARDWEEGCLNIPSIKLRQLNATKGEKPQWRDPITPFTTQILECLNTVWRRAGTESTSCKSVRLADAISLMLGPKETSASTANRLLQTTLRNSTGLLLATGQASILGRVHMVPKNQQKHQLLIPRILGLLLWKLGIQKGDYMKTPAFWVGRMLSLADQLHLQYCYQVRKGEIPPQLVGNSLMSTALNTPEHAISVLAERIRPYYAWAQTVHTGENIGLIKYFLSQLGSVSNQLAELDLPKRTNDADRATMLLGYLSRPEKETKTHDEGDDTNAVNE